MTEVDVSKLKREKELAGIKEKAKDNVLKSNINKQLKPKRDGKFFKVPRMSFKRRTAPFAPPSCPPFPYFAPPDDSVEIKSGVKEMTFWTISRPIAKEKQEKLNTNLKKSQYLNNYIDNSYLSYFIDVSDNIKASLVYGKIYLETLKE